MFGEFGTKKWRILVELVWEGWIIFYSIVDESFLDHLGILKAI